MISSPNAFEKTNFVNFGLPILKVYLYQKRSDFEAKKIFYTQRSQLLHLHMMNQTTFIIENGNTALEELPSEVRSIEKERYVIDIVFAVKFVAKTE